MNGFWFHSTEGQQLLKLAMGEHAISASCTVRTSSGVHHLSYNRWGDSTQRFVPYNGNQMKGKKATLELNRYLRERSLRRQPVRFGPIPRNPSPPGNRRAKGLREGRNPPAPRRRYYSPEIEPLSEEDTRRQAPAPFTPVYRRGRKYPSRAFRQIHLPEGLLQPPRAKGTGPPLQRCGPTKEDKESCHKDSTLNQHQQQPRAVEVRRTVLHPLNNRKVQNPPGKTPRRP